jgi:hypothetical protein
VRLAEQVKALRAELAKARAVRAKNVDQAEQIHHPAAPLRQQEGPTAMSAERVFVPMAQIDDHRAQLCYRRRCGGFRWSEGHVDRHAGPEQHDDDDEPDAAPRGDRVGRQVYAAADTPSVLPGDGRVIQIDNTRDVSREVTATVGLSLGHYFLFLI